MKLAAVESLAMSARTELALVTQNHEALWSDTSADNLEEVAAACESLARRAVALEDQLALLDAEVAKKTKQFWNPFK